MVHRCYRSSNCQSEVNVQADLNHPVCPYSGVDVKLFCRYKFSKCQTWAACRRASEQLSAAGSAWEALEVPQVWQRSHHTHTPLQHSSLTSRAAVAPSNSSWQVLSSTFRKLMGREFPAAGGNCGSACSTHQIPLSQSHTWHPQKGPHSGLSLSCQKSWRVVKHLGRQACHAKTSESRSLKPQNVELHLADRHEVSCEQDHAC